MASSKDGDSDGSFTPTDGSDTDEQLEGDSDYGTEEEEHKSKKLNIQWTGYNKKTPVILFESESVFNKKSSMRTVGERYHMAYKFGGSECKIVRNILSTHGFHEVHPNSPDFNFVWTGAHLKPFTLRSLSEFQKINHFPRSYELTRKDRLYKNLQRMQQIKGIKHFDIIPASFVLPGEYQDFCSAYLKDKGPWIVKPVASSRGRGIFLVNHPDQIPLDENIIVCRYLANPLLIDGFKFDVRLYVAVTSYDPLQIYLYEEGLTRFATVKYEKSTRHIRNHCMHLTNYSVNKKNDEYVKNDDADVEDYGNKWSLGAMLRYLRSNGRDTAALMMKIEDCVIKTILSVELPIATACKMFMPFKGNCYELYGFDILVDDNLKPWVIEVNLSPSLACDSPLDLKIKGNMLCDLFSMTGIICHDPMLRTIQQSRRNQDLAAKMAARSKKQRPSSAGSCKKGSDSGRDPSASTMKSMSGLNSEEIRLVRRAKEEDVRKGGWVRIFPTADSWDLYSSFLQFSTTHNLMLHQKLFPDRHKGGTTAMVSRGSTSAGSRTKTAYIQLANNSGSVKPTLELAAAYAQAMLRTKRYERKLGPKRYSRDRRRRRLEAKRERRKLVQGVQEESGEDQDNEEQEENEDDEQPITERNISEKNNQLSQKVETLESKGEEVIEIVVEKENKVVPKQGDKKTGLASLSKARSDSSVGYVGASDSEISLKAEDGHNVKASASSTVMCSPTPQKYNVVELLAQGHTLSKVQARSAFAMYLVRVQQRLMSDGGSLSQEDMDGINEQMDLVLRFLKRAAVNLQQTFKVVVPSKKLPMNDRRRILAKQLGDFVHIYNKHYDTFAMGEETDQLRARRLMERKHTYIRRGDPQDGLDDDKFDRYVHTASEGELEEVLTTYTRINKSASIFLGGKASTETSHVPTTGNSMQHIGAASPMIKTDSQLSLNKRKDSIGSEKTSPPKLVSGWEDVPRAIHSVPTSSYDNRPPHAAPNTGNPGHGTRATIYSTNSAASYANAVQVYTQKLNHRPRSAATTAGQKTDDIPSPECKPPQRLQQTTEKLRSRPSSAHNSSRGLSTGNSSYGGSTPDLLDPYNEKVITDALQRLSMRQQARQYSAVNGSSLVPSEYSRPSSASSGRRDQTSATAPVKREGAPSAPIGREHGEIQRQASFHETNGSTGTMLVPNHGSTLKLESGDIASNTVHSGKYVSMEDQVAKNRPPSGGHPNNMNHNQRAQQPIDLKQFEAIRKKQSNINLQSANATFNSFIEETGGHNWQNDLAMAYSQVTGVAPQNYHTPSQSSKQYQIIQQQAMKQQSKVLLEQSKAKHQAMIAQAHAVQKSMHRPDSENGMMTQMYAPKPPIKPGNRKVISAHHARVQRRTVPEETSLNFQFCSSNKPSTSGGW